MKIQEIIGLLENIAPPVLQETYDNAGLITGSSDWNCTGILVSLDATEAVIDDAIANNCNLVIAHHPIIFAGLKKITGSTYVERTIVKAIKNDIAIYAIHTNLDNVQAGVNGKIAAMLGLVQQQVLQPKNSLVKKLSVFVPLAHAEQVRAAIFTAGAGHIGKYSDCSFNVIGEGTFKPGEGTSPFVGQRGERHTEQEVKIEAVFKSWMQNKVVAALLQSHPYEEVAYDIVLLENALASVGSGLIGQLKEPITENNFLLLLKKNFQLRVVRHTRLTGNMVQNVAVCGGAGSSLIKPAAAAGADFYVTADVKYHEFFDAGEKMVIADIGHYESEQYTIDLLFDILTEKYPNFAVLKTGVITNPVNYFV